MAKRQTTIITSNKEIYEKLNMLHFSPEVVLKNVKPIQIEKIINSINKKSRILDIELIGDYILVKRINPVNFRVYMNQNY